MSKRALLAGSLVLLVACQTAGPKGEKVPTAASVLPAAQPQPPAPAEQLRQKVQRSLEEARQAVEASDEEGFLACEAAIVHQASQAMLEHGDDAALAQAVGELWDELDILAATLYADEEEGEATPPELPEELVPASPEKVAEATREAEAVTFDLPVKVTPEVAALIDFYTGPYREKLLAALQRAARFLPTIRQELARRQLPQDLAWLPLVESAFQPAARSRAKATGLWQFMAGTARLYNLRCDGLVDERLDPARATGAALDHLADLYATFGDWELALAAYNSGPGRVERALRRAKGKTSFWEIRKLLPRETRNYVPAFWAALIVAKQPEKYGLPTFPEERPCREMVPVEGALDLEVLAERGGFDLATLRELNPALVRGLTPPSEVWPVAVPCGQGEQARTVIAAIPKEERIKRLFHTVRPGETVASIARRYGVSAETIMAANGIANPRTLRVGRELLIPKGPWQPQVAASTAKRPSKAASLRNPLRYRVKPGDTLYSIARKHGLTVEAIQARNNLSGTVIRPGDVLYLAP
jgi:membrane-bound lytic murein transglycosylase D